MFRFLHVNNSLSADKGIIEQRSGVRSSRGGGGLSKETSRRLTEI